MMCLEQNAIIVIAKIIWQQPNHVTASFSTDCSECHNIFSNNWTGTGFNHSFFPLTNGHQLNDCSLCHVNGNYSNLSSECVSCHLAKYNATTNPNHTAVGIPTTCKDCHSTGPGWTPAKFPQHDVLFPISSGKHSGFNCTDCHTNTSNYSVYACTDCHTHSKNAMDNAHSEVGSYVYNSVNCYTCHPNGRAGK